MQNNLLGQIIMVSKLAIYGVFLQCLSYGLLQASDADAQRIKTVHDVYLNISFDDAPLSTVFSEIEAQTDFTFNYYKGVMRPGYRVNIPPKKQSVADVLLEISKETGLSFRQINNTINVKANKHTLADVEAVEVVTAQGSTITGRVITDEDKSGLPGVNVLIKGTSIGTVTDVNGAYKIDVPSTESTLVFSSVGYLSQEVSVGNKTLIDITMSPDVKALQEIIVVGYGTQKKSDLTGSVSRADIESFKESPNVSIAQSLQGTVPGLNIGQVDAAGEDPSISVRGQSTINGNRNVLIVVDGIIYGGSLTDLNPNDIASIDVLKDPSSKAIYGAQAANGVILVTTKIGKKSSKPIFRYSGSFTTQNPANTLTLMDRDQFIQKSYDVDWESSYQAPEYTQLKPDWSYADIVGDPELRKGYDDGTDYDWWANATNPGYINDHSLSVSGKGDKMTYYLSGGYTQQKGFIINDEFSRITTRINIENKIFDWFKVGAQTFGSFSDYSGNSPNISTLSRMTPLVQPTNEDGGYILNPNGANIPNPFLEIAADDFDKRNSLFGNFYVDLDVPFIKGLNYRLNFGNNYSWDRHYSSNTYDNGASGGAFKNTKNWYDWTLDHIINYKKAIAEKHRIDLTLVAGERERKYEDTNATGSNYSNLRLSYNDLSLAAIQNITSSAWKENYLYQMARINYEYDYKYLLTATVRRDGFSGFAKNEKTALFPSVGLGWVMSEEAFLDREWLNNLKLRVSYGTNGNLVNRYSSLAILDTYAAYVFGDGGSTLFGQQVKTLANPNLTWETTTGFNFGLDFAILDNRISGSLDYYRTTTHDLIFDVTIPQITGFKQITSNVGEVDNHGIELTFNGQVIQGKDFSWNINFNLSSNRNKIVSLIGLDANDDGQEDDLTASGLFIGQPIKSIYSYQSAGMIQLGDDVPPGFFVGTHRIVDQNNDDFIDANDRTIMGHEEPAYRFGILNELNYKNLTFRFFINSIQGGKDGYRGRNMLDGFGSADNIKRNNMWNGYDYWTPSNPNARYRRLDQEPGVDYIYYGNRSFVRLQDVTLAYQFKTPMVKKIGLESLKVFVSGKNLFTWTDWQGWDPETASGFETNGRPVMRGYSIGLDVNF